jgi:DNA-binding NarL/FixJ family response regulator
VRSAIARVHATVPDVVVLDVRLPDGTGIDACREIRSQHPTIPCLILTAFEDQASQEAAILAGAQGWLLKDIRGAGLVTALRRVANGEQLIREDLRRQALSRLPLPVAAGHEEVELTLRERQILALIADGMTNRQIGEKLQLAEKTVKNYVSGLLDKLGLERRTQAAVYGMRRRGPESTS